MASRVAPARRADAPEKEMSKVSGPVSAPLKIRISVIPDSIVITSPICAPSISMPR